MIAKAQKFSCASTLKPKYKTLLTNTKKKETTINKKDPVVPREFVPHNGKWGSQHPRVDDVCEPIANGQPPFFLGRRGWGHFTVNATVKFKDGRLKHLTQSKEGKKRSVKCSHSLHFGSPLACTNIFNSTSYIIRSSQLTGKEEDVRGAYPVKHTFENFIGVIFFKKKKKRDHKKKFITKSSLQKKKESAATMSRMIEKSVSKDLSVDLIHMIASYATLETLKGNDWSNESVELVNCVDCDVRIMAKKVYSLHIKECKGCVVTFMSVDRCIEVQESANCKICCKGIADSYHLESCHDCQLNCTDTHDGVAFLLYSSHSNQINIFDSYAPSTRIDQWPPSNTNASDLSSETDPQSFAVMWRKIRGTANFTAGKITPGGSLMPIIS
ncbi:hypothetical protein RFI_16747 [Reticulomyxa filosa]|uniref:C-CAP/cofactor C-like domain-containing protein n=1 Tax=Reticulomyxa filosa TaxID=46433 RepID=X6N2I6_RETFI|nr:hypothetical protein RFI_16747 [Reticulomyxa filosa]|eukprot:ETO20470.1 hypothetical protein RFI_16747 [Reticulomyxa filosa]